MNPYSEIGELREYVWELERSLFLIILESKHNNGESPFSNKVWELAEEGLSKKPKWLRLLPRAHSGEGD